MKIMETINYEYRDALNLSLIEKSQIRSLRYNGII